MSVDRLSARRLAPTLSPTRWLLLRLVGAAALIGLTDWMLWNFREPGAGVAVLFAACGATALLANPLRASGLRRVVAILGFLAALAAVVEYLDTLSLSVAGAATLLFAVAMTSGADSGWRAQARRAALAPFAGAVWAIVDLLRVRRLSRHVGVVGVRAGLLGWIAPAGLTLVFLLLFAEANPLIETWLVRLEFNLELRRIHSERIVFWLAIFALVWPFLHLRRARRRAAAAPAARRVAADPAATLPARDGAQLFGRAAVTRSLVLFNALFALQTALDLAYLWGGLALPAQFTYAQYAHRGAYPLIVTALLAAGFVLIAMRPGGPAAGSRLIRPLVLVFVAQNGMLVASSILRTGLYVAAYSLTELRFAALVWMGLVAVGLALILTMILTGKSLRWLVDANAIALALTLLGYCFVDVPRVVATFNVAHCREAGGEGPALDVYYLLRLGRPALPAIEAMLRDEAMRHAFGSGLDDLTRHAAILRTTTRERFEIRDWRSWSFRDWRLGRYLRATPPPQAPDSRTGQTP